MKTDRIACVKSVDDDLKAQLAKFWKYLSAFRKNNSTQIQLHVDGMCVGDTGDVAEHSYTTFHNIPPPLNPISVICSDSLPLLPTNDRDIQKAIKRQRPTKHVRLVDIPGFIIKGCSTILVPVLKYIFNPSVFQKHFLAQWKQAVIVLVCKKGSGVACVHKYRLNISSQ